MAFRHRGTLHRATLAVCSIVDTVKVANTTPFGVEHPSDMSFTTPQLLLITPTRGVTGPELGGLRGLCKLANHPPFPRFCSQMAPTSPYNSQSGTVSRGKAYIDPLVPTPSTKAPHYDSSCQPLPVSRNGQCWCSLCRQVNCYLVFHSPHPNHPSTRLIS